MVVERPKATLSSLLGVAPGATVPASPGRFLVRSLLAPARAFHPGQHLPSPGGVVLWLILIDLTLGQLSFSISSRACRELGLFQITQEHARRVSSALRSAEFELYIGGPFEILVRAAFRTVAVAAMTRGIGGAKLSENRVNLAALVGVASQAPQLLLRALEGEESWRRGPRFTLELVPKLGFEAPWMGSPPIPIDSEVLWNRFPQVASRLGQIFVLARGVSIGLGLNGGTGLLAAVGIGVAELIFLDSSLFRLTRGIMNRE